MEASILKRINLQHIEKIRELDEGINEATIRIEYLKELKSATKFYEKRVISTAILRNKTSIKNYQKITLNAIKNLVII